MNENRKAPRGTSSKGLSYHNRGNSNSPGTNSLNGQVDPTFYVYSDEFDQPLFREVRKYPKSFHQERWDPVQERWLNKLGDVRRVLYHLPEVCAGVEAGRTIFVVEGCKDVESLRATGRIATCNPGGVGMGWAPDYNSSLRGAIVIVVQDRDPAGHEHAMKVAAQLKPVVRYLTVMESRVGNDVSDGLAAGKGLLLRPAKRYVRPTRPKRPDSPHHGPPVSTPAGTGSGIAAVLGRLTGVTGGRGQWAATCPAHEDDRQSLSVGVGRYHPVVMNCQAGCATQDVLAAIGLTLKGLM